MWYIVAPLQLLRYHDDVLSQYLIIIPSLKFQTRARSHLARFHNTLVLPLKVAVMIAPPEFIRKSAPRQNKPQALFLLITNTYQLVRI